MGLAKTAWIEAQKRGWDAPDKCVCADCVHDLFLEEVVGDNLEQDLCDYCGRESDEPIAAPVEYVIEVIAETVHYYYSAPQDAGVPYEDGEWALTTMDTAEVMADLEFECQSDLFDDVLSAFNNTCWIETADGFWAATRTNQRLRLAWKGFVDTIKHKTRFHFRARQEETAYDQDYTSPEMVLSSIAELLRKFEFLHDVPEGTSIFRCRVREAHDAWALDENQLGAPPSTVASAGRMNPAGISYFYGAFVPGTAIAEVAPRPPTAVAIGAFQTTQPLTVIDLTKIPSLPSVFDSEQRNDREAILFLREFTRQISQPVQKNGMEHIEYVPSQVVCEYLAQVFSTDEEGGRLDGIIYPSTMKQGVTNIVLFPSERSWENRFDGLKFISANIVTLSNWDKLTAALAMNT